MQLDKLYPIFILFLFIYNKFKYFINRILLSILLQAKAKLLKSYTDSHHLKTFAV